MPFMPGAVSTPSPNHGGSNIKRVDYRWLIIHRTAGSYPSDLALLRRKGSNTGATFYVRRSGTICQLHDSASPPWTSKAANPRSITVECEGTATQGLTPAQAESVAKIAAWVNKTHKTALVVCRDPSKEGGVSYHRQGRTVGLDWGRTVCPGDQVVAQIPAIVSRAKVLASPPRPAPAPTPAPAPSPQRLVQRALNELDKRVTVLESKIK